MGILKNNFMTFRKKKAIKIKINKKENKKPMKVNVVDAIMGSGKTSAAINYINSLSDNKKVMYITPYLNEVTRIIKSCPEKKFYTPKSYGTKIEGIKDLLNKGRNIVTTHALFQSFDDEIIDLCYSQGYILFMDEVTDVIEPIRDLNGYDVKTLLNEYVDVDSNTGLVVWREEKRDYNMGMLTDIKKLCDSNCLVLYSDQLMLWMFPVKIFNAFRESYILTYMFHAQMQKYYYDFNNVEYNYLYIEGDNVSDYKFTDIPQEEKKFNYNELINIWDEEKLNMIGDDKNALSKTWYIRNADNTLIKQLKNNTLNFFNNKPVLYIEETGEYEKSKSSNNIWTTFKDYKALLSGKGYSKGFLSLNARATNEYRDRTVVAYLVNKFFNPVIKNFFSSKGIQLYEDDFALSEMLQFIWRSGIRDGKHITVYIPSLRMRNLLKLWLAEQNLLAKDNGACYNKEEREEF